jgi:8-oxo-dGTP pyrophosphatase MutT (NUDIX family)
LDIPAADYLAHAFPVSVKGVAVQGGRVLLLENERAEWELPGGKLELGEDPSDCVVREISEEAGWQVSVGPLLDCWQYHIRPGSDVVIVTYGCNSCRRATSGRLPRGSPVWAPSSSLPDRTWEWPGRCEQCGSPVSPSGAPPS